MKRLALLLVITSMALIYASAAEASVSWPMTLDCARHPRCIQNHMNSDHQKLAQARATNRQQAILIRALQDNVAQLWNKVGCIGEVGMQTYRMAGAYDRDDNWRNRGDSVAGQYSALPRFFGPLWDPWNGTEPNIFLLYDGCGGRF